MSDEINEGVTKAFMNIFTDLKDDQFSFETPREEIEGWDSLNHMQLVSEIESSLGISFDMGEVVEINTPEDLVMLVEKKKSNA